MSVESLLEQAHLLWVLIDSHHRARLAQPVEMPAALGPDASRLGSFQPEGYPFKEIIEVANAFLEKRREQPEGWGVLVSVLRPGYSDDVREVLSRASARELTEEEYLAIESMGMSVAFGAWADARRSRIFLIA